MEKLPTLKMVQQGVAANPFGTKKEKWIGLEYLHGMLWVRCKDKKHINNLKRHFNRDFEYECFVVTPWLMYGTYEENDQAIKNSLSEHFSYLKKA